jgi:cytochrome oxidase Cu insertion factor (SCO1/SenC/PrrC family)
MIGLTGSVEQLKEACKAYRVYFSALNADDEDYLVDHTIITYLMNPDGVLSAFFGQASNSQDIATKVQDVVAQYNRGKAAARV